MIKDFLDVFKTEAVREAERAQDEISRLQKRIFSKLDKEDGDVRELAQKLLREIAKNA